MSVAVQAGGSWVQLAFNFTFYSESEIVAKLEKLNAEFDFSYIYSDDFTFYSKQKALADQIRRYEAELKRILAL